MEKSPRKTKFGLVVYPHTDNIGDDIQSYAAMRFLPSVDYYLDRESLDSFCPGENEIVAAIMNGWYLHDKSAWPPSPFIHPLYVGIHFSLANRFESEHDFLTGVCKEHFLRHAPIGCRDPYNREQLNGAGIEAYESGCLTITIPPFENTQKGNYICAVDVSPRLLAALREDSARGGAEVREATHNPLPGFTEKSWDGRFADVEELLRGYQEAVCVVTPRLHCALPALALGVPVLLIHDESKTDPYDSPRFSTVLDWLHNATEEGYLSGNGGYNVFDPPPNKTAHMESRDRLIAKASEFIGGARAGVPLDPGIPGTGDFRQIYARGADWRKRMRESRYEAYEREINRRGEWMAAHLATIEEKDREIVQRGEWMAAHLATIEEKDREIVQRGEWMASHIITIDGLNKQIELIYATRTYRAAQLVWRMAAKIKQIFRR